jgi:putative RecB family exonuclease
MTPAAVVSLSAPRIGGADHARGVFDYVSASRLNLWLKCPLAFRLKYIDGIRFPTPPAVFLGKQVHAALEWHYRNRQLDRDVSPADVYAAMVSRWGRAIEEEDMRFASPNEEASLQCKAIELVRAYLSKVAAERIRPLAVETALEAPLVDPRTSEDLGIPLVGVMDLVLQEDAGPVIVDFKTAARADELSELAHEIQLGCYGYLFRQATGASESALEIRRLVKTKVPQISFHRWPARSEQHFGRLFAVIRAYLDDLHAGRFVFRPGQACSYCDFRERHCFEWAG